MKEMIKFHEKNGGTITISLWPVENVSEFGVVAIEKDRINKFVEKPRPEDAPSNLINAGAYLIERGVLDYIEPGKLVSMEKEIFPKVINDGKNFMGFRIEGYWIDVGRISSYLKVHKILMEKKKLNTLVGPNSKIAGKINGSCLGKNVLVKKGSKIEGCIVYDGVVVGENVKVTDSVDVPPAPDAVIV